MNITQTPIDSPLHDGVHKSCPIKHVAAREAIYSAAAWYSKLLLAAINSLHFSVRPWLYTYRRHPSFTPSFERNLRYSSRV